MHGQELRRCTSGPSAGSFFCCWEMRRCSSRWVCGGHAKDTGSACVAQHAAKHDTPTAHGLSSPVIDKARASLERGARSWCAAAKPCMALPHPEWWRGATRRAWRIGAERTPLLGMPVGQHVEQRGCWARPRAHRFPAGGTQECMKVSPHISGDLGAQEHHLPPLGAHLAPKQSRSKPPPLRMQVSFG